MCVLTKSPHALWFAATFRIAVTAIAIAAAPSVWPMPNRPISCCATGSPPIPPIRTSRPTSRASPRSSRPMSRPRSNSARPRRASSRRALYQLGRAYAANRQVPEAIAAWRKAADKGSTSAMVELGVLYGTGAGVAKDEAQARKLFERAAAAGNPRGISNLAALRRRRAPPIPCRRAACLRRRARPMPRRNISSA